MNRAATRRNMCYHIKCHTRFLERFNRHGDDTDSVTMGGEMLARSDHSPLTITAADNWFALDSIANFGLKAAMCWRMVFILSHGIEDGIGQRTAGCHTRQDGRYINTTTPIGLLIILDHRHVNITQCSTTAS